MINLKITSVTKDGQLAVDFVSGIDTTEIVKSLTAYNITLTLI